MNMITALLGATGLLLAAAVTLSVMKMTGNDDEAELKKIRAELAALSAQQSQLNPPAPVPGIDPSLLAPANPAPSPLPPAPSPEGTGGVVASPPATIPIPAAIDETPGPEARSGDPTREELLGSSASVEEIRAYIGADSLGYLSEDGLYAFQGPNEPRTFCDACFTNRYPVPVSASSGPRQLQLFHAFPSKA